jgi:DNA polymerase III subunit alpha
MVYQEQVMQIAQVIGGYSLGAADLLRRAMGKKLPEEMAKQRDAFIGGAARNGVEPRKANELFDLMAKFAGYGFNKSHAAAYALIAFQTAYMKAHHPASFMAANLSAVMDDTDKVQQFYLDAVANGLKVLPPDINASDYRFVQVDERTIRYGLGAVKGTGEAAIGAIVQARAAGGPFSSLMDFCERIDKRIVNRRAIEALVRAGAFDAIDDHRARLAASLGIALEAAEQASRDARQVSLFGAAEHASRTRPAHVEAPRWDERRRLAEEKTALGFYLSGHPFGEYRRELSRFVRGTLADLQPRNEPVIIAGSVAAARTAMTRRGKMAVVMLDDGTAQAEVAVYNELWDARRDAIKQDRPLIVQGKVVKDEFTGGLRVVADKLWDLAGARAQFARGLRLALNGDARGNGAAVIGRLRELLTPYRNGTCPVKVCYASGSAIAELKLGEAWRVTPADALIDGLSAWLKPENVEVVYTA